MNKVSLSRSTWLLCKKTIEFIPSFLPSLMFPFVLSFNYVPCVPPPVFLSLSLPFYLSVSHIFGSTRYRMNVENWISYASTRYTANFLSLCEFPCFHSFFIAFCSLLRRYSPQASIPMTDFFICSAIQYTIQNEMKWNAIENQWNINMASETFCLR